MKLHLKFFASVRERLGTAEELLDAPAGIETVGQLRGHLAQRGGAWAEALAAPAALRMAVNHVMCGEDAALTEACEVAFFPPVTGG